MGGDSGAELVALAKLVKLYRSLQARHRRGDRSATLRAQGEEVGRRLDVEVDRVLSHRQGHLFGAGAAPAGDGPYRREGD